MSAMEEWQRRMKAEKEAERQKKNESADILRNFRGGDVEEAKKLKAAREEDRRKKEEAQRALQEYKGNDMEELKKLKAQREEDQRKKLEAQSQLREYKAKEMEELGVKARKVISRNDQQHIPLPVNSGHGEGSAREEDSLPLVSVSERAAALAKLASKSDSIPLPPTSCGGLNGSKSFLTFSDNITNSCESVTEVEFGAPPPTLSDTISVEESSSKLPLDLFSNGQDSFVPEKKTAIVLPQQSPSEVLEPLAHSLSTKESSVDVLNDDNNTLESSVNGYKDEKKAESVNEVPLKLVSTEEISEPELIRLDVMFSFGLVTVQVDPALDSYMDAVEQVVIGAIDGDVNLQARVTYDNRHKPFVKSTQWDDKFKSKSGREDVRRMVVTAGVPVFLNNKANGASISQTREGVVEALSAAIQTGSFLTIARKK